MPRRTSTTVGSLVASFVRDLVAIVDRQANERARAHVLAALGGNGAPGRRGPGRPKGSTNKVAPKAKRKFSAKQHKAAVLQGRYMGSMRTLAKGAQAQVKAAREKGGIVAAIALAKKLKGAAAA